MKPVRLQISRRKGFDLQASASPRIPAGGERRPAEQVGKSVHAHQHRGLSLQHMPRRALPTSSQRHSMGEGMKR